MIDKDRLAAAMHAIEAAMGGSLDARIEADQAPFRAADPEARYPFRTWAQVVCPVDGQPADRFKVVAWGVYYSDGWTNRMLKDFDLRRSNGATAASAVLATYRTFVADHGQEDFGDRFYGSLPHDMICGFVLMGLNQIMSQYVQSHPGLDNESGIELPDCGDPTCRGHGSQRPGGHHAQEAMRTRPGNGPGAYDLMRAPPQKPRQAGTGDPPTGLYL